ncbi:tyrosine-type recombinase/integrase [Natrinema zhouii]|uniref:Tyrosine-type recombinase/integrase n=1 Tax=Natrinema zhouii TaxID=1710539 RepID=A0A7D6CMW8_9EURY|nr:tyrosine-type recombinase/integrase [Natrinema zhouii]QLK25372.1 tyrosine-type recombinase/integrase [Natrinema zhouii]
MGDIDDFQSFDRRFQQQLDRIDEFHPKDQPYVKRFVRKCDGRVKTSSMAEYLGNLRLNAKRLDQPLIDLDEDSFDEFIFELQHSPEYGRGDTPGFAAKTVQTYQFALKKFLTTIDSLVETDFSWAEDIELVTPDSTPVTEDDILTNEDIKALCDGANNLRDIALVEFLADTGARISLVGSLRVGDVDLESDQATFTPNPNASGLKGAGIRPYPIIDAKATLRTYLHRVHPRPDRDDVAFFHKMEGHGNDLEGDDGSLAPQTIRNQLHRAAEKADLEKPVNPHNFRHSAITRMRREGYDRAEVEHRVHWTVDSNMWSTYEHISGEQHNDAIFEKVGLGDSDDGPSQERQPCGNCLEPIAPYHDYCPRCGDAVTPEAREATKEATAEGSQFIVNADGEHVQLGVSEILSALATNDVQVDADTPE